MHSRRTWTTKDAETKDPSSKQANAPHYVPNNPMPVQQGNIPAMPPRRRKPT